MLLNHSRPPCWFCHFCKGLSAENIACRFPGLKTAVDYIQSVLQEQVTLATGQDYGSFAALNGIPLSMDFITNSDVTAGARRVYGQSCLTESNTLYEVWG